MQSTENSVNMSADWAIHAVVVMLAAMTSALVPAVSLTIELVVEHYRRKAGLPCIIDCYRYRLDDVQQLFILEWLAVFFYGFLFGLPVFVRLRRMKRFNAMSSTLTGLAMSLAPLVPLALVSSALEQRNSASVVISLESPGAAVDFVFCLGLLGAASGFAFWLVWWCALPKRIVDANFTLAEATGNNKK